MKSTNEQKIAVYNDFLIQARTQSGKSALASIKSAALRLQRNDYNNYKAYFDHPPALQQDFKLQNPPFLKLEEGEEYQEYNELAERYNKRLLEDIENYVLVKELNAFEIAVSGSKADFTLDDFTKRPTVMDEFGKISDYKKRLKITGGEDGTDAAMFNAINTLAFKSTPQLGQEDPLVVLAKLKNECDEAKKRVVQAADSKETKLHVAQLELGNLKQRITEELPAKVEAASKVKKEEEQSSFTYMLRSTLVDPIVGADPVHKAKMDYLVAASAFAKDPSDATLITLEAAKLAYDQAPKSVYRQIKEAVIAPEETEFKRLTETVGSYIKEFNELLETIEENKPEAGYVITGEVGSRIK